MSVKSRAKNFSTEEIALLVDLVQENKPSLFGALSPSLTSEEKVNIWEDIAQKLTQAHGTVRTKDDVSKKWSNILAKHKPIISDKLSSIRKTGCGSPEGNLSEMELKIKSIKGKELFEGVASGIDLSLLSPISPLSESEMSIGSATDRDIKPRRKRKFFDDDIALTHSVKNVILQGEQEKLVVWKSIDTKLDRVVGLLEAVVSNQNRMLSNNFSQIQPTLPPFQTTPSTLPPPPNPHGYFQPFLPPHPHHFQTND